MSGVMRLILDREEGSARGDEDFFSVARTIPLVAAGPVSMNIFSHHLLELAVLALDTECGHTLVDCVQGILCKAISACSRGARWFIIFLRPRSAERLFSGIIVY